MPGQGFRMASRPETPGPGSSTPFSSSTTGSIPKKGTLTGTSEQDQAIVGCLREVWVYEGPAVTRMLPQTKGTELLVLAQRYSYYTVIKRYEKCITVITGTAMSQPVYTH